MPDKENLFCDVLVIGSGIAGLRAALETRAEGLSVIVISRGPVGRQSSSFYAGGLLRAEPEEIKQVSGYEKGIEKYLYDPDLLPLYSGNAAAKEVEDLISMGIPLKEQDKQYMPLEREQKGPGGAAIMLPMSQKAINMGITCLGNKTVIELVGKERVKGALAIDEKGRFLQISSKAVILATGGGAGLFEHNSNPDGMTGTGYVLALKAGAVLENMEYIHFYPVGLIGSAFPHRRAGPTLLRNKGAKLVNGKGEDIVDKYINLTLQRAIDIPTVRFEMLSKIIAQENKKSGAYIDLTGIPSEKWDAILSSPWNRAYMEKAPVDLRKEKCAVMPLAHTFLGGVKINTKNETSVQGLFAAGEVVGGAYCGEEGSSQLCRCLVMGALAGRNAASFTKGIKSTVIKEGEWQQALLKAAGLMGRKEKENPDGIKKNISKIVYAALGPLRDGATIERALKDLENIDKKMNSLKAEKPSELQTSLEADNMLVLARALLGAALRRRESRGPHYRSDFPDKDKDWFKRILIALDNKNQLNFAEEKILSNY